MRMWLTAEGWGSPDTYKEPADLEYRGCSVATSSWEDVCVKLASAAPLSSLHRPDYQPWDF